MIPSLEGNHGLDTSDRGSGLNQSPQDDDDAKNAAPDHGAADDGAPLSEGELLQRIQEARSQAQAFTMTTVRSQWARSYKAYRNEHFDGSKYSSPEFRGRSKLFRPKTRSAVRKALNTTASAMFSTGDVVSVSAQNDADDFQVASAQIKQELLNYRLSRSSRRNGISWFQTAMGARQDSLITGICASKQYWVYKEKPLRPQDAIKDEQPDPTQPGEAAPKTEQKTRVVIDRPEIMLIPPENVLFDPNCDWTNPAQTADYLIVRYSMTPRAAVAMMQNSQRSQIVWKDITEDQLIALASPTGPADSQSTRAGRAGGRDATMQTSGRYAPVWMEETFIKIDDEDWVLWTVNGMKIVSEMVRTEDAYPALMGDRPIVIGVGAIEAHRPYPTSPVESWQPMQQEINDQVNLRLDHMKQVVSPPAKVMRGRKVDLNQVQRRGPNGIIMLQDMADVEWAQIPDLPQGAFQENNYLNADFDDMVGVFNAGTVATNRSMNETVGGMSLLASSANSGSDFDMNLWVETWAEAVLWQVLKLEEFYESDPTVLAIAGERAQLFEKYGINHITDELLQAETTLQIKVGIGSANLPMERIQKFQMAAGVAQQILAPFVQQGVVQIVPDAEEIISTIFGAAGFQDGGERFFHVVSSDPNQQGGPQAAAQQAQMQAQQGEQQVKMAQIQAGQQKAQLEYSAKMAQTQAKQQEVSLRAQGAEQDRTAKIAIEHQKSLTEIGKAMADAQAQAAAQGRDHAHERVMGLESVFHDLLKSKVNPEPPPMGPAGNMGAPPARKAIVPKTWPGTGIEVERTNQIQPVGE